MTANLDWAFTDTTGYPYSYGDTPVANNGADACAQKTINFSYASSYQINLWVEHCLGVTGGMPYSCTRFEYRRIDNSVPAS